MAYNIYLQSLSEEVLVISPPDTTSESEAYAYLNEYAANASADVKYVVVWVDDAHPTIQRFCWEMRGQLP